MFDPLSGLLVHTGSPQAEVRPRMLELIEWVNAKLTNPIEWPPPVIAGILHFNVVEVHPFADGNGRAARLLTTALLMKTGYAPKRLFNFDAHYGKDKDSYLAALRSVRAEALNQETWMQYFLDGLGRKAAQAITTRRGAIMDATFRHLADRQAFASALGDSAPLMFVECQAPRSVLAQRAARRERDPQRVSDADVAVVLREQQTWESLDELPANAHLALRTDRPLDQTVGDVLALLDRRLQELV